MSLQNELEINGVKYYFQEAIPMTGLAIYTNEGPEDSSATCCILYDAAYKKVLCYAYSADRCGMSAGEPDFN